MLFEGYSAQNIESFVLSESVLNFEKVIFYTRGGILSTYGTQNIIVYRNEFLDKIGYTDYSGRIGLKQDNLYTLAKDIFEWTIFNMSLQEK